MDCPVADLTVKIVSLFGSGAVVGWVFSWFKYRLSKKKHDWELYDRRKKHYDGLEEARKLLQNGTEYDIRELEKLQSESWKLFKDKKIQAMEREFYDKAGELIGATDSSFNDSDIRKRRLEVMLYFSHLDTSNFFNKYLDLKPK
jgi:hypothetical protein